MTNDNTQTQRKPGPGRRTAAAEFAAQLARLDLPDDVVEAIQAADPRVIPPAPTVEPLTIEAMADSAVRTLYDELPGLKGIARVQAIKAILDLARSLPKPPEDEPEPLIADVIADIGERMPTERRIEILRNERPKLLSELAAIDALLAHLEGAA
jgi:hypothetical protein